MVEGGLEPVELVTILAIAVSSSGRSVSAGLAVAPAAEMTVKADVLNTRRE